MVDISKSSDASVSMQRDPLTNSFAECSLTWIAQILNGEQGSALPAAAGAPTRLSPGVFNFLSYSAGRQVVEMLRVAPIELQFEAIDALKFCVIGGEFFNSNVAKDVLSGLAARSENAFISGLCRFAVGEAVDTRVAGADFAARSPTSVANIYHGIEIKHYLDSVPHLISSDRVGFFSNSNELMGVIERREGREGREGCHDDRTERIVATAREAIQEFLRVKYSSQADSEVEILSRFKSNLLRIHEGVALELFPNQKQIVERHLFWRELIPGEICDLSIQDIAELDELADLRRHEAAKFKEIRSRFYQDLVDAVAACHPALNELLPKISSRYGLEDTQVTVLLKALTGREGIPDFIGAMEGLQAIYDQIETEEIEGTDIGEDARKVVQLLAGPLERYNDAQIEISFWADAPECLAHPACVLTTPLEASTTLTKISNFLDIEGVYQESIPNPGH